MPGRQADRCAGTARRPRPPAAVADLYRPPSFRRSRVNRGAGSGSRAYATRRSATLLRGRRRPQPLWQHAGGLRYSDETASHTRALREFDMAAVLREIGMRADQNPERRIQTRQCGLVDLADKLEHHDVTRRGDRHRKPVIMTEESCD